MSRRAILIAAAALAAALALGVVLWRSRPAPTDAERIRALFEKAARAVEEKRVGEAVEAVSERFRGDGLDKRGVKQVIAAHVLRGEWVSVSVSWMQVRVGGDSAEAVVNVVLARSGKGARLADLLPANAAAYRFDFRLEREEGEWRVVGAERRPISLAEAVAGPPP